MNLARRVCSHPNASGFLFSVFTHINNLTLHFKTEYDQIALANAQNEYMQPLPERYHRMLTRLWDDGLLIVCLDIVLKMSTESLAVTLLNLFVVVLGESPVRVRLLFE